MTLLNAIIDTLPLLQHLAAVLTITGLYFIGSRDANKRANGFGFGIFGLFLWLMYELWSNSPIGWFVIITIITLFVVLFRGIWNNIDTIDPDLYDYMVKNGLLIKQKKKI
jgi:predicted branched-subunit amino acid permease